MSRLTLADIRRLSACNSNHEWMEACHFIMESHGGQMPEDWFETLFGSDRMDDALERCFYGDDDRVH